MAENTNLETKPTEPEQKPEPAAKTEPTPSIEELTASVKALQAQLEKAKKATDNASSDAASWKAKFRATQSEAERVEAERAEEVRRMREENEALKRDKTIGAYSNRLLALGYDTTLASATAEAMANGDMDTVFAGIGQLIQTVKTKAVTEGLGKQGGLSVGVPPSTNLVQTKEDNELRKWMGLQPK